MLNLIVLKDVHVKSRGTRLAWKQMKAKLLWHMAEKQLGTLLCPNCICNWCTTVHQLHMQFGQSNVPWNNVKIVLIKFIFLSLYINLFCHVLVYLCFFPDLITWNGLTLSEIVSLVSWWRFESFSFYLYKPAICTQCCAYYW